VVVVVRGRMVARMRRRRERKRKRRMG